MLCRARESTIEIEQRLARHQQLVNNLDASLDANLIKAEHGGDLKHGINALPEVIKHDRWPTQPKRELTNQMQLTLLGTGDVRQVPVYGCECRACFNARQNPVLRRKPCSALLEDGNLRLLIDGGLTDLCERFRPGQLSGILLTHYHMDHIQGLFHLRWGINDHIPVCGPEDGGTAGDLKKHPGILEFLPPLPAFKPFSPQAGLSITPIPMQHSKPTFGYLFEQDGKRIAYLTDTVGLSVESERYLKQFELDVVVIDTSVPPQSEPPRNHNDLNLSIAIFEALTPTKMVLTHLGHEMDEWLLDNELPYGEISVARDGDLISL